ncbi:elongation factor 1-alpha (ef-1-alpha) [Trypanosoma grayi]|uniref:elongation factor 1-alpha (ef-1-alpha) n=1 Tax=Trypanosoma grayi TaxID=71804 RepID=UPI0004F45854|nr:elongation factor 1-alpha (ef-1-alpha) [Trypanosoma grayi]KEG09567.1 elongation factor 1-alpha (ef-1-alpha) [Trypanosoma grayi]
MQQTREPLPVAATAGDEERRRRRRRRLARKSPETRRRRLQYARRHNEKDGRLFYCDYCDLFVSRAAKSWLQHLGGVRHMEAMEAYYALVDARDPVWLTSIREDVLRAHMEERVRQHQIIAGKGATVPLPAVTIGFSGPNSIVVGGSEKQQQRPPHTSTSVDAMNCIDANNNSNVGGGSGGVNGSPSVRVGGLLVAAATPPVVRVGSKTLAAPPVAKPASL